MVLWLRERPSNSQTKSDKIIPISTNLIQSRQIQSNVYESDPDEVGRDQALSEHVHEGVLKLAHKYELPGVVRHIQLRDGGA